MSNAYKKAYADIYYILRSLEEKYRKKVPEGVVKFFRENAEPHYLSRIDLTKPLTEQEISEETEQLICLLNLEYWCTPEEKQELLKKYEINEQILQEQLKNKYEIKFNKNAKIEDVKALIVIEEDSIFKKIRKFIKSIKEKLLHF